MNKFFTAPPVFLGLYTENHCDGSGPHCGEEVRVLPTGGDSNAILCYSCYLREMRFRRERNSPFAKPQLSEANKFKLPDWESLKVYETK